MSPAAKVISNRNDHFTKGFNYVWVDEGVGSGMICL